MLGVTCPAVPPPVKIIRFIITSRLEYVLFLHTSNIIKIISILYFLKEIGQVAKLWRNLQTSQKFEGSKMNDKKDEFKECIAREFEEIAREEEEFLENDTSLVVPEGTKEAVLARVREQIRAYEMEQTRKETEEREEAINHLSEEDREALELGRKMLKAGIGQKDPEEPSEKKVRRKKKPLKMYLALAAVIVCVLAMGITSMGGPERIVRMMTQDVGDREVEYTVKGEKVKTIENEDEEKAYQEIRDTFNTDIVKVIICLSDMTFDSMNLEKDKQVAEMYYNYEGKTIAYIINVPYRENSLGIDFEDSVEKEYTKKINGCEIKITIYKIDGEKIPGCVAKFKYNNIEYLLSGTMKQQDFEKIINNLFFSK
ncbi:DUF4367 domain-containing protein [Dorea longicatena]|uniref:DUF4367 domain-containing protein n=1 Tax=Dorea longicatena TaxID=88431 RepID=A0A414SUU5_9FIRM|nr:DUF4367 domain-containing protein [Dorea longicatena]RHG25707.1 DUF4367 domain-containing protein [Dorea longicatena]